MAIFPGAVAADSDLFIAVDQTSTLLTDNPLTSGAATVNVSSASAFPSVGYISIDAEIIFYTGKTATSFTGCSRGALGTAAAAHSVGAQVDHNVVSDHHNVLKDEIIAIETYLDTVLGKGTAVVAAEFERLAGVTSGIQTQIDAKAPTASPTFTGTVTIPTPFTLGATSVTATGAQMNHLVGVTSAIQTQLDAKAATNLSNVASVSVDVPMNTHKFTGLSAGSASGDSIRYEQVLRLWSYRRPILQYVSTTTVDVGANTTTSGERAILFPDGDYRVSTTESFYRFDITRNCSLSGTKLSGLRSGLSESTDQWYALYAVKATDSSTDWVTVGDTSLPVQGAVADLNTRYGTNGWVYLGMIRNGDNSGSTGDILSFVMHGNTTMFTNICAGNVNSNMGVRLASSASAVSLTWSYSAGTGAASVPDHILIGRMTFGIQADTSEACMGTSQGVRVLFRHNDASTLIAVSTLWTPVTLGFFTGNATGGKYDINLSGFMDSVLGVGSNPLV